jgi:pantoate--beta-alanine ligase
MPSISYSIQMSLFLHCAGVVEMLEIEQKYKSADFATLKSRLADLGASPQGSRSEEDHYFNAPDRDFARTGEAFRLRRVGASNWLTYKGPRQPTAVKIRPELEIPLLEGEAAARQHRELLAHLGYRPVAVVRKTRQVFALQRENFQMQVCLDEVAELGCYAEIEILAEQDQVERASQVLKQLAGQLGLSEVEPHSYLSLLLTRRAMQSVGDHQPVVVTTVAELRAQLREIRRQGRTIGFVPTMGALHEGHRSLIEAARARNECVVVSIFVNPTQFGPNEDLDRYPRPFEDDVRLCAEVGTDVIFHPAVEEIYPPGFRTFVEVTGLQDVLEGASRPGHFRGVATVVLKLLLLVRPDRAYFGQKDAQQVRIVQQLVRDLAVDCEICVLPTVREPDGLALSSRNRYLDEQQRQAATILYQALRAAAERYRAGEREAAALIRLLREPIESTPGAVLDYAAVVSTETFEPIEHLSTGGLLALAVRFGATRLIDNWPLSPEE